MKIYVDGAELTVCPACAAKVSAKTFKQETFKQKTQSTSRIPQSTSKTPVSSLPTKPSEFKEDPRGKSSRPIRTPRSALDEKLELVEDFAERIKQARESLGWDQKTLALKLKISENVVKRIESGKLRPPIDLARRIEEVLNIKILVPAVEDEVSSKGKIEKYVTFGEVVSIRGAEEE